MSKLTDEELTRLAIQELLKDAKRFKDRRDAEFRSTQIKRPMKTNKPFLKNMLRDVLSFNRKRTIQSTNILQNPLKRKLLNKGISHKYVNNKRENDENDDRCKKGESKNQKEEEDLHKKTNCTKSNF